MRFRGLGRDWAKSAAQAETECGRFLAQALSGARESRLQNLDRLSQRLCLELDSAELGRHVGV